MEEVEEIGGFVAVCVRLEVWLMLEVGVNLEAGVEVDLDVHAARLEFALVQAESALPGSNAGVVSAGEYEFPGVDLCVEQFRALDVQTDP